MWNDRKTLLKYARILENKTIPEALAEIRMSPEYASFAVMESEATYDSEKKYNGKGAFGQYLEERYFYKKNDSLSQADFAEVGVELKVSPLKTVGDTVKVKERLVLNIINYCDMALEKFETSHFLEKDSVLLLVFYFYDAVKDCDNLKVDLVDIWNVLDEDLPQIEADWNYIHDKIRAGEAHLLSEGDTLYLGACTKGSTSAKSMVKQPNSTLKAKQRALCFKVSYINHIYKLLKTRQLNQDYLERRFISTSDWMPLDYAISKKIQPYIGLNGPEIASILGVRYNPKDKSRYARLSKHMLDIGKDGFYELNAADIQVKSIRFEENLTNNESMSFKNINFTDIVEEEWEDSIFYHELTSKFIFMVFKADPEIDGEYKFVTSILWNMPESDLDEAQSVWEDTKIKIKAGDYEHFLKQSQTKIAHVRPKGTKQNYLMMTPQGTYEKKKCFWLNGDYVGNVVRDLVWGK